MRDSNRIKPYCDALVSIWSMVPDWRLGQFMVNVLSAYKAEKGNDPFYIEDEDFLMYLFNYISEVTKNG